MKSKATLLGHAIHPMLIVFPLGLLAMAVIFDAIFLATHGNTFAAVAYWDIAAGIVGGLVAAVFGFIDWMAIPVGTRAKAVGAWHGGANFVTLTLFGISWLLRYGAAEHAANSVVFVLEIIGVVIALVGGWLGGELVERLGVSISPNANLDAPSSLSQKADE
jgi:uncharacterized membrane protein